MSIEGGFNSPKKAANPLESDTTRVLDGLIANAKARNIDLPAAANDNGAVIEAANDAVDSPQIPGVGSDPEGLRETLRKIGMGS